MRMYAYVCVMVCSHRMDYVLSPSASRYSIWEIRRGMTERKPAVVPPSSHYFFTIAITSSPSPSPFYHLITSSPTTTPLPPTLHHRHHFSIIAINSSPSPSPLNHLITSSPTTTPLPPGGVLVFGSLCGTAYMKEKMYALQDAAGSKGTDKSSSHSV